MKYLSFVAIVACFLKVSLTWSISNTSEIPPQPSSLQNQITPGVVASAADQICYHQYGIRINTVISKIKNGTDACNRINDETRFKINEEVKEIQDLSTKCNLELNTKKYIECMTSSAAKEILNQISLNADKYLKQYKTCPIEIVEGGKYRSSSALYDLKLCLQKNHPSTLPITLPKSTDDDSSGNNVEFLENLNRYRMVYATLKICVLDGLEFEECWEEAKYDEKMKNIHSVMFQSGANNYEKIAEIDKAENSCIRQFIIMVRDFRYKFDLKDCLMRGYNATIQFEEDEEKDIELIQEYSEKLSEIIEDIYAQHFPCIETLFKMSQSFSNLRLNKTEKNNYISCVLQGYKSPLFIPKDNNILDKLKEITDYIKSCTLHTDSPGFEKCLVNGVMVYRFDLLLTDDSTLEFKELLEKFDKNHNTCFRTLVAEYQRLKPTFIGAPEEPRKPEELELLEKCVMNNV